MPIKKPISRDNAEPSALDAGAPAGFASAVSLLCGLLLAGRAIFLDYGGFLAPSAFLAARLVLALLLSTWGVVRFASAKLRPSWRFLTWLFGSGRSVALLSWTALAAAADVLDGSDPLVFVIGASYAAVIGWDRMGRFLVLNLAGASALTLATLGSWRFLGRPLRPGYLLLAAGAMGVSMAIARTVRSYVAPGRERLRSLERENKQLWDLSFKDALTGLYNRRFAQETGRLALARSQRYHEQLHVFMIDIDHFKNVNDQLSHAVGDVVLQGVAQSIQACLRTSDSISRYGGEEFLAFVVRAEADLAQFIANRIREAVAARKFPEVPWTITVSIGVASAQEDDTLESLIDRSDKYLYYSKRGGRNRVSGF